MLHEAGQTTSASPQTSGAALAEFLLQSGNQWLMLLGRGIKQFGFRIVSAFCLGSLMTFGYVYVKPLPVRPAPTERKIVLHGKVQDYDGQPLSRKFQIGILADSYGPFETQGEFSVEVPEAATYDILVWDVGQNNFNLLGDVHPNQDAEGRELTLPAALRFPANVGIVDGTVENQNGRPVKGWVEVMGVRERIGHDGHFRLRNIPLGRATIKVLDDSGDETLREESITLALNAPTPSTVLKVNQ